MKNIAFVPLIHQGIPCTSNPISFSYKWLQVLSYFGCFTRYLYSRHSPVSSSIMDPAYSFNSLFGLMWWTTVCFFATDENYWVMVLVICLALVLSVIWSMVCTMSTSFCVMKHGCWTFSSLGDMKIFWFCLSFGLLEFTKDGSGCAWFGFCDFLSTLGCPLILGIVLLFCSAHWFVAFVDFFVGVFIPVFWAALCQSP